VNEPAEHSVGPAAGSLPYRVTPYYAGLAGSMDPCSDPIAAQFVPRPEERVTREWETADPLADERYRVGARVIHHYRDRVLILAHDRCATYCRHCFRRHFTAHGSGAISADEISEAAAYLAEHEECEEALISGGEPLLLPDSALETLFTALRRARPELILRLATRMPVVQPSRITRRLAGILGRHAPLWTVVQVNHPAELTEEFRAAILRIVERGVPVLSQTVLLRGVNDDADTMEALLRGLLRARVKPYYLFQGDLAAGTSHFRTTIDEGLALVAELRRRISGLAIPTYAVDLPGGAGKIALHEGAIVRREAEWYVLRGPDGSEHRYPRESAPG